jgi:hypothetical protein
MVNRVRLVRPPTWLLVIAALLWAAVITVAVVNVERDKRERAQCELAGRHVVEAEHGSGWSCLP